MLAQLTLVVSPHPTHQPSPHHLHLSSPLPCASGGVIHQTFDGKDEKNLLIGKVLWDELGRFAGERGGGNGNVLVGYSLPPLSL